MIIITIMIPLFFINKTILVFNYVPTSVTINGRRLLTSMKRKEIQLDFLILGRLEKSG